MGVTLIIKGVRASFTQGLEEPYKGKYGGKFILPKDHPQLPEIEAAIKKAIAEKWPGKNAKGELIATGKEKAIRIADKLPIHDGDTKPELNGFEGNLFISAGRKTKPLLTNRNPKEVITLAEGIIYPGCKVNIKIDIFAYHNIAENVSGVSADLQVVQFAGKGESFGGSKPVTTEGLDAVEEEEEEEDLDEIF